MWLWREEFADEAEVGAAGETDLLRAAGRVEFGGEGPGKSLRAGAARVNERAVNVK